MNIVTALKKLIKWMIIFVAIIIIGLIVIDRYLVAEVSTKYPSSKQYKHGIFYNKDPQPKPSFAKTLGIFKRFLTEKRIDSMPNSPLPISMLSTQQLDDLPNDQLYVVKLGHSSLLLKIYGKYWLIDPMFSQRASPFSFMGPERFQHTPISVEDLPAIEQVLISHNHYDHLDKHSMVKLAKNTTRFLVPLGVEGDLIKWGIPADRIIRFDWWQEHENNLTLVALTPSQHFSGRGLSDRNTTLWGSWVIKTDDSSLFFSGDSGYFDGFKKIGQKYGPFDMTFIETGAYNNDWPTIHMLPEDSVQAHIDLNGKIMVPIHNGTFDLAFHPWYEPLKRVTTAAHKRHVNLSTPIVGEIFSDKQSISDHKWWVKLLNENN